MAGKCMMYGGYIVTRNQVCDSYVRGKPGSEKMEGDKPTRPHHLHVSTGSNCCGNCGYYKP